MKEKPNFNKKEYDMKKVYQIENYVMYRVNNKYYAIENIKKSDGINLSLYVKTFKKARSLIDLAIRKKIPNTPRKWEIRILIKISDDKEYISKLQTLLNSLEG